MRKILIAVGAVLAAAIATAQLGLAVWAGTTAAEAITTWSEASDSADGSDDGDSLRYFEELQSYRVRDDATLYPEARANVGEAWDLFRRVAGDTIIVEHLISFAVGHDEQSDIIAYVRPAGGDKWTLVVNLAFDDPFDQALTMVHEYAHLLSLNATQIDADAESCARVETSEGCILEDAVLDRFQSEFWDMYGWDVPDPTAGEAEIHEFWDERDDQFVSEYAASSVVEDFAESFATFVWLEGDPPEEWGYEGLAAEKIVFFESDPAMIVERDRILAAIQDELY